MRLLWGRRPQKKASGSLVDAMALPGKGVRCTSCGICQWPAQSSPATLEDVRALTVGVMVHFSLSDGIALQGGGVRPDSTEGCLVTTSQRTGLPVRALVSEAAVGDGAGAWGTDAPAATANTSC